MSNIKQYHLPAEDVNDEKATVVNLFFDSGDKVKKNDLIYTFETSKSVIDVESEFNGFIEYYVEENEEVNIGSLVCEISKTRKEKLEKTKNIIKVIQKSVKPTKKALKIAKIYGLDIEKLGLVGIIKERDLIPFIQNERQTTQVDRCLILNRQNKFIQHLLDDESFRILSSEEKIEKYKDNDHKIGKNVKILKGAVLIGNKIEIHDNVSIGVGTYIESPEINIGANTTIGNDCEFVASSIRIGERNKISNNVIVDISGGRSLDSNLITGRDCLIAYESYVNVCRQVLIGQNVALSPKSMIFTHSYWQSVLDGYTSTFGPVTIEDSSWVGSMSHVLPNITVGTGSIITSNSLVKANVKPFTMVGGVPAELIKENLKKSLSQSKKEKIIKGLFFELGNWLYTQHFDIEKINENLTIISNDKFKKSCFLFEKNMSRLTESDAIDIIISINITDIYPKTVKTIFDINNLTIQGPVETIEYMIIEFFRRRGICFQWE